MLKKGWIVENSIERTLKNLVAATDAECVKKLSIEEFTRHLVNEVKMISAYDAEKEAEVTAYIKRHAAELRAHALSLPSKPIDNLKNPADISTTTRHQGSSHNNN